MLMKNRGSGDVGGVSESSDVVVEEVLSEADEEECELVSDLANVAVLPHTKHSENHVTNLEMVTFQIEPENRNGKM